MANTSVTYAGTGAQVNFTVPFPFISRDHVKVYVNGAEVLQPSIWYWVSDSQITFRNAPTVDAGIKIQRVTPGDTRLVDFQNGAVLTEADLDLSATQNFYLTQEAKENYAELINAELVRIATAEGIVDTDPDVMIASLVDTMLADASANTLQAAVGDIELNGEVILDIQTKLDGSIEVIDLIGAFNGDKSAFLLDHTKVKLGTLDTDPTFATTISTLEATDTANTASINTINTVTVPGINGDISALEARYGVTLNVNGYITGFSQNNDGDSGAFVVLADKFAVVTPSPVWEASTAYTAGDMIRPTTPTTPSRVFKCTVGGTSGGSEPSWNTTLLGGTTDNTVTWTTYDDASLYPFTVDGDTTYMNEVVAREVRYGKDNYADWSAGYFLGDDSGTAKFKIGNSTDYLAWDGSSLTIKGDIELTNMDNYWVVGFTGFSTNPFYNLIHYVDLGNMVVLMIRSNSMNGTSNSTQFTITGMPLAIRPSGDISLPAQVIDNGVPLVGGVTIKSTGVIEGELVRATGSNFYYSSASFTSSGQKGFYGPQCWVYSTTF